MSQASAYAAALAGLPGMGPAGLVRILSRHDPESAWQVVLAGRIERPSRDRGRGLLGPTAQSARTSWSERAHRIEPTAWWSPLAQRGVGVTWWGSRDYPAVLLNDPQPPGVLFWLGNPEVLERPAVAIVGTRNATPDGRAVAYELGRDLAAAGICVVSGLALGIDGAAHAGSLKAIEDGAPGAAVGVAASGVDVPYPRRHVRLWAQMAAAGLILSENLPGRPAQAWRFPSRNRVIAGLVRMVVVVESHAKGGSLITAEAALERGVEVRVVPGPVRSPASAGSNQLLYDGPGPVRSAQDVLDALGIAAPARRPGWPDRSAPAGAGPSVSSGPSGPSGPSSADVGSVASGAPEPAEIDETPDQGCAASVLEALGWRPASIGQLMLRSGLDAARVGRALDHLRAERIVAEDAGWWVRMR